MHAHRWGIAPYFFVDDVVRTANDYRDRLGFHYDRFGGDPPSFCMVKRSGIVIMLSRVLEPDALYEDFRSGGVTIARAICDQAYGCRDFEVEDCNGYRLCFGQDIEG